MLPNLQRNLIRRMWETSGCHPAGNATQIVGMVPSGCARFARMPKATTSANGDRWSGESAIGDGGRQPVEDPASLVQDSSLIRR
jgi:hypothetical protein